MAAFPTTGLGGARGDNAAKFLARQPALGDSERVRTATTAELYYLSKQHEGKAPWWDQSVKLRERAPRITVPLYRKMIETLDRWLWSGNRAPRVRVEATAGVDDEVGPVLTDEDAETLCDFVNRLIRSAGLLRAAREATNKALITTSAAVVITWVNGRIGYYVRGGKDCTPTFENDDPARVASLDIRYKFPKDEPIHPLSTQTQRRWYWYRRLIDDKRDVVFKEVLVRPDGLEPQWVEDPDRVVKHALGFCPVVWFRTLPDCDDLVDGKPVIDPALYPLLDAISYTVSQRQRAVEVVTDPQPWAKGLTDETRATFNAKSPGQFWELPADSQDSKSEIGYLELNGTGPQRAAEHTADLEQVLREVVGVVDSNPEVAAKAVTGAALEMLYQPMTALCSDLRYDVGDCGYAQLLDMAVRVVATVRGRGDDVWVPGARKVSEIVTRAQKTGPWLPLPIVLDWPDFFNEGEADKLARVQRTVAAEQAGYVTRETAVRTLAPTFGVDNPNAEIEALEKKDDEDAADEQTASSESHARALELKAAQPAPLVAEKPADVKDTNGG